MINIYDHHVFFDNEKAWLYLTIASSEPVWLLCAIVASTESQIKLESLRLEEASLKVPNVVPLTVVFLTSEKGNSNLSTQTAYSHIKYAK
jgi:hypothetical protein